ncbi:hypothetical protein MMC13_003425 [Lambiella insularis]|nr:hypothetical protein [Lambiella insularis]
MEGFGDTENSYSPSQWVAQDSILRDANSPIAGKQICEPTAQTPLDVLSVRDTPVPAPERPRRRKPWQSPRDRLPFLRLEDWDPAWSYNEEPPTCVHYDIVWKVVLSGKEIAIDTECNIVLEPALFWQIKLHARLMQLTEKKSNTYET